MVFPIRNGKLPIYHSITDLGFTPGDEEEVNGFLDKFQDYQHRGEVYYVYMTLHRYTEEPFTSHLPEALFNMARFLLHNISQEIPYGWCWVLGAGLRGPNYNFIIIYDAE